MYFRHGDSVFSDDTDLQFWMHDSAAESEDEAGIWMQVSEGNNYMVFSGSVDECERFLSNLTVTLESVDLNLIGETTKRYRG